MEEVMSYSTLYASILEEGVSIKLYFVFWLESELFLSVEKLFTPICLERILIAHIKPFYRRILTKMCLIFYLFCTLQEFSLVNIPKSGPFNRISGTISKFQTLYPPKIGVYPPKMALYPPN